MALDTTWLEQVPVLRTPVRVYFRTVHIPATGAADPFRVKPNEGRWPTDWTLYTGSSPQVAWAEYCRNWSKDVAAADVTGGVGLTPLSLSALGPISVGAPLPQRALYELTFAFERLADLLSPWGQHCVERAGFPLSDFYADGPAYGMCPALAASGNALGWEGMRVPSAALRTEHAFCLPVFAAGRARLTQAVEAVPAAHPTVAMAYATTYVPGERPSWLII